MCIGWPVWVRNHWHETKTGPHVWTNAFETEGWVWTSCIVQHDSVETHQRFSEPARWASESCRGGRGMEAVLMARAPQPRRCCSTAHRPKRNAWADRTADTKSAKAEPVPSTGNIVLKLEPGLAGIGENIIFSALQNVPACYCSVCMYICTRGDDVPITAASGVARLNSKRCAGNPTEGLAALACVAGDRSSIP